MKISDIFGGRNDTYLTKYVISGLCSPGFSALNKLPMVSEIVCNRGAKMGVILLVDDELTTKLILKSVLSQAGKTVFTASDGTEALEEIRVREAVDIVITDINMPNMDGLELTEELRKAGYLGKIIVISPEGANSIIGKKSFSLGADAVIEKPVLPEQLLSVIKEFES